MAGGRVVLEENKLSLHISLVTISCYPFSVPNLLVKEKAGS